MIPDFDALHERLGEIVTAALRARENDPQAYAAAEMAVREVGEAISLLAGFKALANASDAIEIALGEQAVSWLSRQWVGITAPDGKVWTD